ncbi:MAG: hypothetical protein J6D46_03090 [Lachnospiraceae bacterium]|nr:hypothetical protein [Lachnospiraceae bacterium]
MNQLREYFFRQFPVIEQHDLALMISVLLVALLYVFFGYKLLRVYISILGLILGAFIGVVICAVLDLTSTTVVLVIIGVSALALAVAGFLLYKVGLFVLIVLSILPVVLTIVDEFATVQPVFMWVGSALIALILAVLAMFFVRPVVIIATAFSGGISIANLIVNNILPEIAEMNTKEGARIFMLIIGLVIAVLGIYFQFMTTKPKKKAESGS